MHWQLLQVLQRLNIFHVKLALLLALVFTAGMGAGLGALALGWKGALGLPLVLLAGLALAVHGLLTWLLRQGLKAWVAKRRMLWSWSGARTVPSASNTASCAINRPTIGSATAMLKIMIGPMANMV